MAAAIGIWLAMRGLRDAQRDQATAIAARLNGAVYVTTRADIAAERLRVAKCTIALFTSLWVMATPRLPSRLVILGAWVATLLLDDFMSYLLQQAQRAVQDNERRRLNSERQTSKEGRA